MLDAALLHEVIAGHDPLDSTSIDAPVPRGGRGGPAGAPRRPVRACASAWSRELGGEGYQAGRAGLLRRRAAPAGEARRRARRGQLPALRVRAGRVLPDPAQRGARPTWPGSTPCATACGSATTARVSAEEVMALTREAGFGPEVKRRIILGTYALSVGLLRRLLRAGAEGAHADRAGLRRGLRAGRRAGLADHADHGVPDRREGGRPAGHVPQRPGHDPDEPGRHRRRMSVPSGLPPTTGCRSGCRSWRPALGEAVMYRVAAAYEAARDAEDGGPLIQRGPGAGGDAR